MWLDVTVFVVIIYCKNLILCYFSARHVAALIEGFFVVFFNELPLFCIVTQICVNRPGSWKMSWT